MCKQTKKGNNHQEAPFIDANISRQSSTTEKFQHYCEGNNETKRLTWKYVKASKQDIELFSQANARNKYIRIMCIIDFIYNSIYIK